MSNTSVKTPHTGAQDISTPKWFVAIAALISALLAYSNFLIWNENRLGSQLNDPVLQMFAPVDLSVPIFVVIYGSIALFFVAAKSNFKWILWRGILSYTVLVLLRMACMWVTPLAAPSTAIVLVDPLAAAFTTDAPMMNDLFFSGHTATLFLLTLLVPHRWKLLFGASTLFTAISVLAQHVHYTVDVVVALFASSFAFAIGTALSRLLAQKTASAKS